MSSNTAARRQAMLNSKKTDRIIIAVSPELKSAVSKLAKDRCVSMSSLISSLLADEVLNQSELEKAN